MQYKSMLNNKHLTPSEQSYNTKTLQFTECIWDKRYFVTLGQSLNGHQWFTRRQPSILGTVDSIEQLLSLISLPTNGNLIDLCESIAAHVLVCIRL